MSHKRGFGRLIDDELESKSMLGILLIRYTTGAPLFGEDGQELVLRLRLIAVFGGITSTPLVLC